MYWESRFEQWWKSGVCPVCTKQISLKDYNKAKEAKIAEKLKEEQRLKEDEDLWKRIEFNKQKAKEEKAKRKILEKAAYEVLKGNGTFRQTHSKGTKQ